MNDWKCSVLSSVFNRKGDNCMECGSYLATKLLEHAMKVVERALQRRIREKVNLDNMLFGFRPRKDTVPVM